MAANRANMAYYIRNQIADADGISAGKILEKEVSLTSAQILALTTPVELVEAPGPNKIIEFVSAVLFLDHGGTDYANGGNIVVRSSSAAQVTVSGTLTSAASINLAHDNYAMIQALNAAIMLAAEVNEALELYSDTDHITGNGTARIKVMYHIHDFS